MDKHAYLIIAHNEFEILKLLIDALDYVRNDIYIHFDSKCKILPNLKCNEAGLYILCDRIDVRWGDYSQIETEMLLFEYAHDMQKKTRVRYLYYHLISGVDLPLNIKVKNSWGITKEIYNLNSGKKYKCTISSQRILQKMVGGLFVILYVLFFVVFNSIWE